MDYQKILDELNQVNETLWRVAYALLQPVFDGEMGRNHELNKD